MGHVKTLVTAPAAEPISAAEVKAHSNITTTDDDTLIGEFITAARMHLENVSNRAFYTQTWDVFLDSFSSVIELPKAPLQTVTTVKYLDTDGAQQTLSSSVYTVDADSDPGRIYLAYQQSWPSIRGDRHSVEIRIVTGYGVATAVPEPIRQAILLTVANMYENRESVSVVGLKEIPFGVKSLMANYR